MFEPHVQNREDKQLAQDHAASQLQVWNLNLASGSCTSSCYQGETFQQSSCERSRAQHRAELSSESSRGEQGMGGQRDRACWAPRVGAPGLGSGGQAGPSPWLAGSLTGYALVPDSGRLPRASVVSLVLGAVLICGLAGLTWTVVCRW